MRVTTFEAICIMILLAAIALTVLGAHIYRWEVVLYQSSLIGWIVVTAHLRGQS